VKKFRFPLRESVTKKGGRGKGSTNPMTIAVPSPHGGLMSRAGKGRTRGKVLNRLGRLNGCPGGVWQNGCITNSGGSSKKRAKGYPTTIKQFHYSKGQSAHHAGPNSTKKERVIRLGKLGSDLLRNCPEGGGKDNWAGTEGSVRRRKVPGCHSTETVFIKAKRVVKLKNL